MCTILDKVRLPPWVNWLAQDADGTWWGFEVEPLAHHCGWYENEVGRCVKINADRPNPSWAQSLVRVYYSKQITQ